MRRNEPYKPWHQILQPNPQTNSGGLWLGDYSAAVDKKCINSQNIKTVLTAATGLKVSYPSTITHKVLQLYDCDTENISRYFAEAFSFLTEGLQRGNVYVHCFAGVSRSATIVISFLMKKFEWSVAQAMSFTKKKRRYIEPNPGFMRQLRKYERELFPPQINSANNSYEPPLRTTSTTDKENQEFIMPSFRKKINRSEGRENKENKNELNIPRDMKKSLSKLTRPMLIQDIDRIYLSTKSLIKKGTSHGKSRKKLPDISPLMSKYL